MANLLRLRRDYFDKLPIHEEPCEAALIAACTKLEVRLVFIVDGKCFESTTWTQIAANLVQV